MTKQYVNEPNLQITMTEYNDNMVKDAPVWTPNGQQVGYVSQVYDNRQGAGEQVYVVVADPNLPADQVQQVTVLMKGSTSPQQFNPDWGGMLGGPIGSLVYPLTDDQKKTNWDIAADWLGNDIPMGRNIIASSITDGFMNGVVRDTGGGPTAQMLSASAALQDILTTYPNAQFSIYGHSLGSMDVQYSLSQLSEDQMKRLTQAWLSNGPNIYSQLNPDGQAVVDALKSRIFNYIDPKDLIGLGYGKGSTRAVGMVFFVDSKKVGLVDQHMTYGYQLDKNGQIKLLNTLDTAPVNQVLLGQIQWNYLKAGLSSNGLSTAEELYLDSEYAHLIATGLGTAAELAHDLVGQYEQEALQKAVDLYLLLNQVPIGFSLSPEEVASAYRDAGVHYQSLVQDISDICSQTRKQTEQIKIDFQALEKELAAGIEKQVSEDVALAGEIRTWMQLKN